MLRATRIFKTLTSLLFVVSLLLTYSYTAKKVNLYIDLERVNVIKAEELFFYALGAFVLFNIIFLIFDRMLLKYRAKKNKVSNLLATDKFQTWLAGLGASVNLFLTSIVVFIGFLNSDANLKLLNYAFVLYVGPVAILICLLTLPLVFIPQKRND